MEKTKGKPRGRNGGRKPEEKSKRFCKMIKVSKYDLFCQEYWDKFKKENLKK